MWPAEKLPQFSLAFNAFCQWNRESPRDLHLAVAAMILELILNTSKAKLNDQIPELSHVN